MRIRVTGPEELEERGSREPPVLPGSWPGAGRSFTSEGTQTEPRARGGNRREERAREKKAQRKEAEEAEAEKYRKLSVQEAAYRKLSQQYEVGGAGRLGHIPSHPQEQLTYGLDSLSLDSGEDSKADDMDEMTMPNPGSIQVTWAGGGRCIAYLSALLQLIIHPQHFERLFYPAIPCKNCSTCYVKYEEEIFGGRIN